MLYMQELTLKVTHEVGMLSTIRNEHHRWAIAPICRILKLLLQMSHYLHSSLVKVIIAKMEWNKKNHPKDFCRVGKRLEKYVSTGEGWNLDGSRATEEFMVETIREPFLLNQVYLHILFENFLVEFEIFSKERDFHEYNTKTNIMLALTAEVGELAKLVQWSTDGNCNKELDMPKRNGICMEMADIAIYAMRLAVAYDVVKEVRDFLSVLPFYEYVL